MEPTGNPPAFEEAVHAYLAPAREQFNYEQMRYTFLSTDRFQQWAAVMERYRSLQGARFLSSGCGFAGSLLAYRAAGARVAFGVEVDDEYLGFGVLRTAELTGAGVVKYDGQRLPFGDGAFDVIESMDVIEHTADPRAYLAELRRVLAPGGLVLLVTPNRLWPVEQHLAIAGPPWLPVGLADLFFGLLAQLPFFAEDRRFRYRKLRGMRTQNISLRRLHTLAKELGFLLRVIEPEGHQGRWPLPLDVSWVRRLARNRWGKFIAPARTLVVTLEVAS